MTEIMTPSEQTTTGPQIDKAVGNYRAMLEKHAPHFAVEAVQVVLGSSEFAKAQFGLFRKSVELVSNLIFRTVTVNDSRSPQEAINATGRTKYLKGDVIDTMPYGEVGETKVVFFKPDLSERDGISDDDLEKEFELRGLKPAGPRSVAAVNEADPAFADEHPNATHWKDGDGNWCYVSFLRWHGRRSVSVYRYGLEWGNGWWFAGVGK